MTLKEYQKQAQRTCPSLGSLQLDLSHMVLGIMSEQEELQQAYFYQDWVNIGEELADKMFYIANYCTFRNFDLQSLYDQREEVNFAEWEHSDSLEVVGLSQLQDQVKKFMAYGRELNSEIEERALQLILLGITCELDVASLNMENILQNNINKLRIRYPEKFTQEKALNRDLEAERKELEK